MPSLLFIEDLFDLVIVRIEIHVGFANQLAFARLQVVSKNTGRSIEAGKTVKRFGLIAATAETAGRSNPGKFDLPNKLSRQIKNFDLGFGILEVIDDQEITDQTSAFHGFVGLRHDDLPVLFGRIVDVNHQNTLLGSVVVRFEIKPAALIAQEGVFVIKVVDQHLAVLHPAPPATCTSRDNDRRSLARP